MQQATLSQLEHYYIKLLIRPHEPVTSVVDLATLHVLLARAMTEMYGRVGAGAMSGLGDGLEILSVAQSYGEDILEREAVIKVASSAVTQLVATLPFSSATEQYSIQVLAQSPSLILARNARPQATQPGSSQWLNKFEE